MRYDQPLQREILYIVPSTNNHHSPFRGWVTLFLCIISQHTNTSYLILHMQSNNRMPKRKHPNSTESERKSNSSKQVKFSHHLPQFLDAESTITASRFATKRIPEMQTLWNKFQQSSNINHDDEAYFKSRGCKQSKRHLRRRTGSHLRRKRHRFPHGGNGDNSNGGINDDSSKGTINIKT